MKKLDFSHLVAERMWWNGEWYWIRIPQEVALAIFDTKLPIEVFNVYDDDSEGLVLDREDITDKRCWFFGVEYEDTLLEYIYIQIVDHHEED